MHFLIYEVSTPLFIPLRAGFWLNRKQNKGIYGIASEIKPATSAQATRTRKL